MTQSTSFSATSFSAACFLAALSARATRSHLVVNGQALPCALGQSGLTAHKREGDGATPKGVHGVRRVFYRPDRITAPATALPVVPLRKDMGWCDDPASPAYNRLVRLPFAKSHETMWRDDHLYDLLVELAFNDAPPVPGKGSAIFLHVAAHGYAPTQGCIALKLSDLRRVVATLHPGSTIKV